MIRIGLIASLGATLVLAAIWVWLARHLPPEAAHIPVHWGISGAPDRFVDGKTALATFAFLPGLTLILGALLAIAPSLDPFRANIVKGRRAYLTAWIGSAGLIAALGAGLAYAMVAAARAERAGAPADPHADRMMLRVVMIGTSALILLVGDALPKTRKNFMLGLRTPWTLSSDLAWEKANRLLGRLFVFSGLIGIGAGIALRGPWLMAAVVGPVVAASLIATVYSYFVWRRDPERQPGAPRERLPRYAHFQRKAVAAISLKMR